MALSPRDNSKRRAERNRLRLKSVANGRARLSARHPHYLQPRRRPQTCRRRQL